MTIKHFHMITRLVVMVSLFFCTFFTIAKDGKHSPRPNILWIVSEDNSPMLGAYGDEFATTPNLDKLANRGIVYDNAFANSAVCAPTRFSLYTGMYANALGTHNMRSRYAIPDFIKPYSFYLKQAGYFVTNHNKTDFNYKTNDQKYWDKGNYKNSPKGQPFFHVENIGISHEGQIHRKKAELLHDPNAVSLPPYHPETPEIRYDWALYYDRISEMDSRVRKLLQDLEDAGLADNTIIFYFSDHGGVIARSKRFLFDSGTKIPLIMAFPVKFKHLAPQDMGSRSDVMVDIVDLAPTILELAGVEPPAHWHGKSLLNSARDITKQTAYLYRGRMDERIDIIRAIRDKKFKYIRNYLPHRKYALHLEYLWRAASIRSWQAECLAGRCNSAQQQFWHPKPVEELYNTESDPWEVNNLANKPEYQNTLNAMRQLLAEKNRHYKDIGFIPEGELVERTKDITAYELVNHPSFPIERVIETAEIASLGQTKYQSLLASRLNDNEAAVRYWAATGFTILNQASEQETQSLINLLTDPSADVQIAAAEALLKLNIIEQPLNVLQTHISQSPETIALHAANVLNEIGLQATPALATMQQVIIDQKARSKRLGLRVNYLLNALEFTVKNLSKN
ncbi:sulfatase-like hydrolase/transferase [Aliiglaciecola lipolytica]|nr:sulfatase-like hydrolase/transferase [Aliiglaciecola lipolytica]